MYPNQGQSGGQNFQKNPNGGYLKPSSHKPDTWYGTLTITPELLAAAQTTGKISVQVNGAQTNQYGPSRRITAKPYQAAQRPPQGNVGYPPAATAAYGAPPHGMPVQAAPARPQGYVQQGYAAAPVADPFQHDEIPF